MYFSLAFSTEYDFEVHSVVECVNSLFFFFFKLWVGIFYCSVVFYHMNVSQFVIHSPVDGICTVFSLGLF